ncbi:hypothetical protein [Nonomuraea ceibae]|uniref:hypothetical protein n=1 Tax=Nonomuraea ceibae TaxID=1935170 RepID=UPI001C5DC586|nr:hypothetical protein [Nonomuraea ceibae]
MELLIGLIHRINAHAERRVEKELIGQLAAVPGKRGIFTTMVNAALSKPDETVRQVVFSAVPGGEKTLRALAKKLMATERVVAERIRYQLRGSYSHYYRRILAPLPAALEVKCHNTPPAGDERDRDAGPLCGRRCRPAALRRGRDGADRRGGAQGVAGRRRRRRKRPGGADSVRACALIGLKRSAPPRDLCRGWRPLARSR